MTVDVGRLLTMLIIAIGVAAIVIFALGGAP